MRKSVLVAALLGIGLAAGPVAAQTAKPGDLAPLSEAAFIAKSCALCHGGPGYAPPNMPMIFGADRTAIYAALQDFKNNRRPYTIMGRIARGFTDDQLKAVADYLSTY